MRPEGRARALRPEGLAGESAAGTGVIWLKCASPAEEVVVTQQLGIVRLSLPAFVRDHVVQQVSVIVRLVVCVCVCVRACVRACVSE